MGIGEGAQTPYYSLANLVMQKLIIGLIAVVAIAAPGSAALAYELPQSVSTESSFALGAGEVDFSRASVVEGTVTVDRVNGDAWITAGDVAHEATGYGFYIHDDMLYGVSNTGGLNWNLPLGFVRPGQPITVRAAYTPNDGIRFDTQWQAADWGQYSRGIIQGLLPNYAIRGLGALFGTAVKIELTVGSWKYSE